VIDDRPQANSRRFYDFDSKQQDGEGDEDVFPGQHPVLSDIIYTASFAVQLTPGVTKATML